MLPILSLVTFFGGAAALSIPRQVGGGLKVALGNDDGWATANIRTFYNLLNSNGFQTILSCPASNKSGTSSLDLPPIPLIGEGQFGTIPSGASPVGSDPNDSRINYVNSFPVTAIKYGLDEVCPREFNSPPDIVLSGPNVGDNLGIVTQFSGTVGVATEALHRKIPAIAFSGVGGTHHSFKEEDPVAQIYAELALKITQTVVNSGPPFLPESIGLNVNFPLSDATTCTSVSDFSFILSRVNPDINFLTDDVRHCGTNHLPIEHKVIDSGNCRVSISAFNKFKLDVNKEIQGVVRDKLQSILTCLPE